MHGQNDIKLGSVLCRAWRWLETVETCSPEVVII